MCHTSSKYACQQRNRYYTTTLELTTRDKFAVRTTYCIYWEPQKKDTSTNAFKQVIAYYTSNDLLLAIFSDANAYHIVWVSLDTTRESQNNQIDHFSSEMLRIYHFM